MQTLPAAFKEEKGLTLIEVLISIALLAFISIAISQATIGSFRINNRLGSESADYTALLLSMQTVETDIQQLFTLPLAESAPPDSNEQPSVFWSVKLREDGFRRSHLKGNAEKLTFISNGNRRLEADSPQSDFLKVTWEVERNNSGAYTLFRTTDWNVYELDDNTKKKPQRVAMLSNLASAKFTYYKKENKSWEDQWDTEGPYIKQETRFPELIALDITLPDPTNSANQIQWKLMARPYLAPNFTEEKKAATNTPNSPGNKTKSTGNGNQDDS